ncbi:hypothetical protein NDU88_008945 [Pleurodeles waltl]|uniref:Uncharacterized protein n=1 Tax=Pleurodeles waltl TaxID=8319 RepID=A0AAV7RX77_PLEWA|nr:hypothetical protein NDU88_008945 [Pleurodeles waltl]
MTPAHGRRRVHSEEVDSVPHLAAQCLQEGVEFSERILPPEALRKKERISMASIIAKTGVYRLPDTSSAAPCG